MAVNCNQCNILLISSITPMDTPKVLYERLINILAVILPFWWLYSIFETKMPVLRPTSVGLFCCFLAVYSFPQVSLIMAILNTHKTRTDNVLIVDVTNVSHQETKTKNVRNFSIFTDQDLLCHLYVQSSKII